MPASRAAPPQASAAPSAAEVALWGIFACLLVCGILLATGKGVRVAGFAAGALVVVVLAAYAVLRAWGAELSNLHEDDSSG